MTIGHEAAAAHLGVTKTKDALFKTFYWPKCFSDVEDFVKTCDTHKFQRVGKPQDKKKAPLKIVPVITEIFTKINIDASGPLPMTPSGNKYIITALCMSSRYPDTIPVANLCSTTVVNALLQIFSRMGFPRELQTDQGTSFMSALTTEFLERFGVKVVRSSVYHPQTPSRPNKLSVQWVGPGEIVQQLSETNYVVKFPEKDKTHVHHVNMLKPYHQREENINLLCINPLKHDEEGDIPSLELENERSGWSKIISDVQLNSKLFQIQRGQLKELLYEYSNLFSNIPGCTDLAEHDIELESERAIVAKPYKKVSAAKYISILDLTRGCWQIPLSPRAQWYASFVTTFGTFKPLRLPFGLKNAPYYFSRLMANLLRNCEDFAVPYLDDIAIFSLAWDDHLKHLKDVFNCLRSTKLHIKPSKCQFAQAYVKYLGHLVGQGLRTPGELKVQVIKNFPIPTNKTQVRAFFGLSGY
ncbi:retrovirus-related Pol polyprotein from transposon 17.6 [Trichonephila clavipes]|nr:retrovirus-related Pol polyprotein from transposon 17.6 [Trichonephila clavipes]